MKIDTGKDTPQSDLPEGAKFRLGKSSIIGNVTFSPDGTRLAVAGDIGTWIYDAHTGEEVSLLAGHTEYVWSVAYSPNGETVASGSYEENGYGIVQLDFRKQHSKNIGIMSGR